MQKQQMAKQQDQIDLLKREKRRMDELISIKEE